MSDYVRTIDSLCLKDREMVLRVATPKQANMALCYLSVSPGDLTRALQRVSHKQVMEALGKIDDLAFDDYVAMLEISGVTHEKIMKAISLDCVESDKLLSWLKDDGVCIEMVIAAFSNLWAYADDFDAMGYLDGYINWQFPGATMAYWLGMNPPDYYELLCEYKLSSMQILKIAEIFDSKELMLYKTARDIDLTHDEALRAVMAKRAYLASKR